MLSLSMTCFVGQSDGRAGALSLVRAHRSTARRTATRSADHAAELGRSPIDPLSGVYNIAELHAESRQVMLADSVAHLQWNILDIA